MLTITDFAGGEISFRTPTPGTCYASTLASSVISWPLFSFPVLRGYADVLSLTPRAFPRRVKGRRRGRGPTSMRASLEGILRQHLPQLGSQLSRRSSVTL